MREAAEYRLERALDAGNSSGSRLPKTASSGFFCVIIGASRARRPSATEFMPTKTRSSLAHLLDRNRSWALDLRNRDPEFFTRLAAQQAPKYLWIGCSDSRVPANQIIDMAPGVDVLRTFATVASRDMPNDEMASRSMSLIPKSASMTTASRVVLTRIRQDSTAPTQSTISDLSRTWSIGYGGGACRMSALGDAEVSFRVFCNVAKPENKIIGDCLIAISHV